MEVPHSLEEDDFRDRKVDVLRAIRRYSEEEVKKRTILGATPAGRSRGALFRLMSMNKENAVPLREYSAGSSGPEEDPELS
jgi:glucose-6-phosphate 1-dehydrogenase